MTTTRNLFITIVLIVLTFSTSAENKEIHLGFIAPLTGPFPEWGESIRRGVEIATLDTRHKFFINYEDDSCDPKRAVTIAQRFFSVEKLKFVIGPGCDDSLLSIAPIAKKNNALLFSTGLLGDTIFKKHENVINFATQISSEAKRLARQIHEQGIRNLAIVYGTNTFGEEYNTSLRQALAEYGITTASEATDLGISDFRSVIARIFAKHPDGVYIHQGNAETISFVRQLRDTNKSVPLFSYYTIENESFKSAGTVVEGITYSYPMNSSENSEKKLSFDLRYKQKYGEKAFPSITSYYVYDGMMLLDKAFDSCASDDSACVSNFFKNLRKYQGISGDMIYRNDGGNNRTYGIKRIVKGSFSWVSKEL